MAFRRLEQLMGEAEIENEREKERERGKHEPIDLKSTLSQGCQC